MKGSQVCKALTEASTFELKKQSFKISLSVNIAHLQQMNFIAEWLSQHNGVLLIFFANANCLTSRNPGYLLPIQARPSGYTVSSPLRWGPQYSLKTSDTHTSYFFLTLQRQQNTFQQKRLHNCIISNISWVSLKSIGKFSIQTPRRLEVLLKALGLIGCDGTCQSQLPSNLIDYFIGKLDMLSSA